MNDSELDQLLKSYGSSQTPPGFRSDVWNRIAVEPESVRPLSMWIRFFVETFARLSQPAAAIATCAAFVIAGSLIGLGSRPHSLPPEIRYIQSVSPFIHQAGR